MDPMSPVNQQEIYGKYILEILQMINTQFANVSYNNTLEQGIKAAILGSYSRAVEAVMLGGRFPVVGNLPLPPTLQPQPPIVSLEGGPIPGFPTRIG